MKSHQELLRKCQQRDAKAQHKLYDLFSARLMGLCRRYTRRKEEAQDVLQEAFIKIFTSIHQLESAAKIESWMKTIAVHTAINHYHRTKRKEELFSSLQEDEAPDSFTSETITVSDERLISFINELPDGCRVIFNLFAVEGYNHSEIAALLKVTEGTSRSQYHYAKSLLKSKLNCQDLTHYYEKFA